MLLYKIFFLSLVFCQTFISAMERKFSKSKPLTLEKATKEGKSSSLTDLDLTFPNNSRRFTRKAFSEKNIGNILQQEFLQLEDDIYLYAVPLKKKENPEKLLLVLDLSGQYIYWPRDIWQKWVLELRQGALKEYIDRKRRLKEAHDSSVSDAIKLSTRIDIWFFAKFDERGTMRAHDLFYCQKGKEFLKKAQAQTDLIYELDMYTLAFQYFKNALSIDKKTLESIDHSLEYLKTLNIMSKKESLSFDDIVEKINERRVRIFLKDEEGRESCCEWSDNYKG
jgi:hypothetical protein